MDSAYRGEIKPYRIKSYKLLSQREVSIVLTEGKNRELRRLFEELGYEVKRLTRIRIGSVCLDDLPSGMYRRLKASEVNSFKV